jgi:signal transduction histidine kinase
MGTPLRVLMVEDSEDDAALLLRELRRGGYEVTFERIETPAAMLEALKHSWDVVVSDYAMPHFSGVDALKILRERGSETPFIFVSGTIGEEIAVAAMKTGAQDYVMKGKLTRLLPAIERELQDAERRQERKVLEQRVQQLQKFEAIGRLAGGIAHDFNNVLGSVIGWAQMGWEEAPPDSQLRQRFQKIRDQAQRAAGLTAQLLAFARRQVLQPRNLDLNESIGEMAGFLQTSIGAHIELKTVQAPNLRVIRADPAQIDQILMNLCLNARDALPNGGRLTVETQNIEISEHYCQIHPSAPPGSYVLLTVSDTGVGMDKTTLDRIFEPFFTTKELGRGTGLGLATVYGIVKQHEGFINVYSEPGHGTTFRIYFPAGTGPAERRDSVKDVPVSKGVETILIAEDHEGLRELAQETLTSCGYNIILAKHGEEAVQLFRANRDKIALVVLDVVMPLLSGPQTYGQIRAMRPDVPVIFTTGHTAESASLSSQIEAGAVFLQKPYAPRELNQAIRSTLDRSLVEVQPAG